jgi:hypothetical protein
MTELEELIQDDEQPTVAGTIELLDKCVEDLGRLIETRRIVPCIHAKNLVYGLEQSRTMLRQVYQGMDAIFDPENTRES